ncbi:hypothetical protein [Marinoscillum pacificum]|uniref:hypothetical protein n=1 Tax=Marinoscillum pacificum TaxID=392723 RepID=UPI0021580829|nr:hypothetical protein [Marinoscillum pacificum]
MARYAVVNILKYKNGKLYFSDDDNSWEEVSPETVTGYPKQNELMIWMAGPGVKIITGIDFVDNDDFVNPPKPKYTNRMWIVKVKPDAIIDNEPKYTIRFVDSDGNCHEVDPKISIKGGT